MPRFGKTGAAAAAQRKTRKIRTVSVRKGGRRITKRKGGY